MPTKKQQSKEKAERTPAKAKWEWFPAFGLRCAAFPDVYLTGRTPEEAAIRLASYMADQSAKLHHDYTVVFDNEPFEID
jgi:hypothetical protein